MDLCKLDTLPLHGFLVCHFGYLTKMHCSEKYFMAMCLVPQQPIQVEEHDKIYVKILEMASILDVCKLGTLPLYTDFFRTFNMSFWGPY